VAGCSHSLQEIELTPPRCLHRRTQSDHVGSAEEGKGRHGFSVGGSYGCKSLMPVVELLEIK
jgi:hypothetical protein